MTTTKEGPAPVLLAVDATAAAGAEMLVVSEVDTFRRTVVVGAEAEVERGDEMTVKQVVVTRSVADGVHRDGDEVEHDAGEHNEQ